MYNGEDPQTPLHFWSRFIPKHKLASTTDVVRRNVVRRDVVRRDVVGVAEIRRENFSWQRFFPQVAVSSCSTHFSKCQAKAGRVQRLDKNNLKSINENKFRKNE